jgi:hypothetical protein
MRRTPIRRRNSIASLTRAKRRTQPSPFLIIGQGGLQISCPPDALSKAVPSAFCASHSVRSEAQACGQHGVFIIYAKERLLSRPYSCYLITSFFFSIIVWALTAKLKGLPFPQTSTNIPSLSFSFSFRSLIFVSFES